jgi:hypothetical protein
MKTMIFATMFALSASHLSAKIINLDCSVERQDGTTARHRLEIDGDTSQAMIDGFIPVQVREMGDTIHLLITGAAVREVLPHLCADTYCAGEPIVIDRYLGSITWINYFGGVSDGYTSADGECKPLDAEKRF